MSLISPASERAGAVSFAVLGVLFSIGSVAMAVIGAWRGAAGGPWWLVLLMLGLSPFPAMLGWVGWRFAGRPALQRSRALARIHASGWDAVGRLARVGSLPHGRRYHRGETRFGAHVGFARQFQLHVEEPGHEPRQVTIVDFLPPGLEEPQLPPGTTLPLLIDPEDPAQAVIHWDVLYGKRWGGARGGNPA
jgi:hypothetical protein